MRVLIISHSYLPTVTPRSIRWAAIAEEWASQGHAVDVLTARSIPEARRTVIKGVNVRRAADVALLRRSLVLSVPDMMLPPPSSRARLLRRGRARVQVAVVGALRRLWAAVYWPDYAWTWWLPAVVAASRLQMAMPYDAVISVSLPFSGHLVAAWLHRRGLLSGAWIADVGDPFSLIEGVPVNNPRLYARRNRRAERRVFRRATKVAVTTIETKAVYDALFPECASKIVVVPPIFAVPSLEAVDHLRHGQRDACRVVFVGTLYRDIRSPVPLLELHRMIVERYKTQRPIELHFYGGVHDCEDLFIPHQDQVGSSVFLHGQVSRAAAAAAIHDADVAVNIGNSTGYQLPSKLIELVCLGKPILNIGWSDDDSSVQYLRDYPGALSVVRDGPKGLSPEQLERVVSFISSPPIVDEETLDRFRDKHSRARIAAAYESLIADGRITCSLAGIRRIAGYIRSR